MAASVATRSTILRTIARSKATFSDSLTAATTAARCPIRSTSVLRPSQISPTPSAPSRLIRRELISLLPLHTAIASACLVSKIPSDLNSSTESAAFMYTVPAIGLALMWHFITHSVNVHPIGR